MDWCVRAMLASEKGTAAEAAKRLNARFESENDSGMVRNAELGQRIPRGEHHAMDSWVGRR